MLTRLTSADKYSCRSDKRDCSIAALPLSSHTRIRRQHLSACQHLRQTAIRAVSLSAARVSTARLMSGVPARTTSSTDPSAVAAQARASETSGQTTNPKIFGAIEYLWGAETARKNFLRKNPQGTPAPPRSRPAFDRRGPLEHFHTAPGHQSNHRCEPVKTRRRDVRVSLPRRHRSRPIDSVDAEDGSS
jgi:hypothetical protein